MLPGKLAGTAFAILLGFATAAAVAQSAAPAASEPQHDHSMEDMDSMHHMDSSAAHNHFEEVNRHGDMAMGFSHLKTTHHFRLTPNGGSIEVQANDPNDTVSRDQVRRHLEQISKAFKAGNFSAPEETHGRVPPGVPAMQQLKSDITYRYAKTDRGGRVLISTANPEALKAVHEFLRFQIQDHRTGDPESIRKP